MFRFLVTRRAFGSPSFGVMPTTQFPPALTPVERAKVDAFFGSKTDKVRRRDAEDATREAPAQASR